MMERLTKQIVAAGRAHRWLRPFALLALALLFCGNTLAERAVRLYGRTRAAAHRGRNALAAWRRDYLQRREARRAAAKPVRTAHRPLRRVAAGALAACLMLTLLPATAFAWTQVDSLPNAAVPSDKLYFKLQWVLTNPTGAAASVDGCENSRINIPEVISYIDDVKILSGRLSGDNLYFTKQLLTQKSTYDLLEYTTPISSYGQSMIRPIVSNKLAKTRTFGGTIKLLLKDLNTNQWVEVWSWSTGDMKGGSWFVCPYSSCLSIYEYKSYSSGNTYGNRINWTPMLKDNALTCNFSTVYPSTSYTSTGSRTLMTNNGYIWQSSDVPDGYGGTYYRMGNVHYENPRIVTEGSTVTNLTTATVNDVSVTANSDSGFNLSVGANPTNGTKFRVAFDVVSAKYGTKTTALSNVFTVSVPAEGTPNPPAKATEIGLKDITISTVTGQKYQVTTTNSAPTTSTGTWKDATGTTLKFDNLNPGTTYYFWTYKPAGQGTLDSAVSKSLAVKTTDPIASVALTLPAPEGEAKLGVKDDVTAPAGMKVSQISWKYKSKEDGNWNTASTSASYLYSYWYQATITVDLTDTTADMFANSVTATVNGQAATVTRTSDTQVSVTYEFPKISDAPKFSYTLKKDGTDWTGSDAPTVVLRKGSSVYTTTSNLKAGEYEIAIRVGLEYTNVGETVTVTPGVSPKLDLNFWTVTFCGTDDQPLTQGYNLEQMVYQGKAPVAPTGTTLIPEDGKVLTWVTKDVDGGQTTELPFVVGSDPIYETTKIYARWVTPISSVAVTGLTAPVGGAQPDTAVTVPDNAKYEVYNVTWSPDTEGGPFAYDTEYTATVRLMAKNGEGFAAAPTGTIDGKTAALSEAGSTLIALTYKFPITGSDPATGVAAAVQTLQNHTFTVPQATANTSNNVKTWLVNEINTLLNGTGVTTKAADVTVSNFTAATAGTQSSTAGTNGSFSFTAKLTLGTATATTSSVSGTVTATAYTGTDKTAAPVFKTGGAAFTKTSGSQSTATFTLNAAPASGTTFTVYTDENGAQAAAATASASGTTLTVSGDAIAGVKATTNFYITAKASDKTESDPAKVTVYAAPVQRTDTPVFKAGGDAYAKTSTDQNTATYTLETSYPENTTFKVYTAATGDAAPSGVTVSGLGTSLTLTGISGVTETISYYITATAPDKTESQRASVTVKPYAAPSVTLAGTDAVVTVTFSSSAATTATASDTINVVFDPGTNPDATFSVNDFKFVTDYGGSDVSPYYTVKGLNVEQNTITVEVKKGVSTAAKQSGHLYYKDSYVGQITSRVTTSATSSDAKLSALALSSGTLNPAFDENTTTFTATVANSVETITVTPTTNHASATVKVNNTTVTSGEASGDISLNVGENRITVLVTAQDNTTTRSYIVTVTREAPVGDAPAFADGGNTYTKTSATQSSATFTLAADSASGTTYKVYAAATGGSPLSMTATASGKTLTLRDISGVSAQKNYYISATPPNSSESSRTMVTVMPYIAPAAAPAFSSATVSFTENSSSVDFTLTNHTEGRTYKVYQSNSDSIPLTSNPQASFAESKLTLSYTNVPTAQTTYYVSATETGKPESSRTAITVKPYVAPAVSEAPAFAAGGSAYDKTSAEDNSATFTLAATPLSGTTYKVYDAQTEGSTVSGVAVSVSNKTLTLTGDGVKNVTSAATWYISATQSGKSESARVPVTVNPYMEQSTAPGFSANTYAKVAANDNVASFTLSAQAADTTTFKVYSQATGGNEATGITAALDGTNKAVLKLTGISALNSSTTYYVSATETGKRESSRTAVTITPYVAPSVTLGADKTVTVTFQQSDADTATQTDTIGVTLNKGSNPEASFQASDFSLSSSSSSNTAISGLSVTAVNGDAGTLTVQMAKSVTAASAYLWYGGKSVGQVTLSKTVTQPTTYTVTIGSATNGTVSASPTSAAAGAEVTLTITPSSGYELDTLSVYKTGETSTTVTVNNNKFTMPAYNVTVSATFKKTSDQTAVESAKSIIESGTYSVAQATANSADDVKTWLATTINNLNGMSATGVTVQASNITVSNFTAAVADTTGSGGSNGSFKFTVSLSKNAATATTTSKDGTITKTAYTPPQQTAAPAFSSTTATLASADATSVTFTLTNAVTDGTYKVYAAATGGSALTDPAVSVQSSTLTLTFTSKPTSETNYYISATDGEKTESTRTAVTVKPYEAPKSSDATLSALSYKVGDGQETSISNFSASTETYNVELPSGTSATAAITLTGTPATGASITTNAGVTLTGGSGSATITVTAENGTTTKTYTVNFTTATTPPPSGTAPAITTTSLSDGTVGTAYTATLTATGDTPITWSVESGSLPAGLSLSGAVISGTPTTAGTSTFTVKAENSAGNATKELTIKIDAATQPGTAPAITTTTLPDGTVGTQYSQTLTATGTTPITWSVSAGSLPAGLTLNTSTGVISGTPTTAGTSTFTVKASNGTSPDATKELTVTINAAGPSVSDQDRVNAAKDAASTAVSSANYVYNATADTVLTIAQSAVINGSITVAWEGTPSVTESTADQKGSISGTIKLTLIDASATFSVNVELPKAPAAGRHIELSETTVNLKPGETAQLTAQIVEDTSNTFDLTPPPSNSIPPVEDQQPTGDNQPPADDQPTGDNQPPVDDQPTGDNQPPADDQPTGDNQPPADDQPTGDNQPPTDDQPTGDNQPPTDDQPTGDNQPPTDDQPTGNNQQPPVDSGIPPVTQTKVTLGTSNSLNVRVLSAITYQDSGPTTYVNNTVTFTWSSGDTDVATVSDSGLITAVGPGTCTITVEGDGLTATCLVIVSQPDQPDQYTATVENGTGGGSYAEGETVSISANAPAAGKVFDRWTTSSQGVSFADATSASTTFTMPANAVTVTATYKDAPIDTYTVTLRDGGSGVSGNGSYASGATVTISAGSRSGYSFNGWTVVSGGVTLANQNQPTTTFEMPAANVEVQANWSKISSGGSDDSSSSSSGGSYTPPTITDPTPSDKPDVPTTAETEVTAKTDSKGNAEIDVPSRVVDNAIDKALDAAKKNGAEDNGVAVQINVTTGKSATGKAADTITVNLPKATQERLISGKVDNFTLVIDQPDIAISLSLDSIKAINTQANADVQLTATRMTDTSTLSAEARTAIGTRPVFQLTASYRGGKVTDFGAGNVSVEIPYTLQKGEVAGNVYAIYVDDNGKVTYLTNSSYDAERGVVMFATDHFSIYGIGYKAPTVTFSDIANHWAKEDIEFVASRGLLNGTGSNQFSPDGSMTRGMFVTALGRLAGIDAGSYKPGTFSDVPDTAYYAPYVEWAAQKGIVQGTGSGKFSPDAIVTRQQMAAIMSNYAKAMGYTVPATRETMTFTDSASIATWATGAVKQMQRAGVLMGKDGNRFDPTGPATRAQASTTLRRYIELVIDWQTTQGWTRNDSGTWMYYQDGKPVTGSKTIDGTTYQFDAQGALQTVKATLPEGKEYIVHTLVYGDTLWDLAQEHGCTVAEIVGLNGIKNPNSIPVGTEIKIPKK